MREGFQNYWGWLVPKCTENEWTWELMSDKIDKMKCDEVWWDFALSKDPMPLQSTGRMQLRRVVCSILKVVSPNPTHKSRGLPGLQHWGFPVVEDEKRNCRKYCVCAVFSAFGFRVFRVLELRVSGFRVRRLVITKTPALRRFLSMPKDNIWTPF